MRLKKEVINIMKVLLNVTLGELDDKINRQILVDENISLTDLCEFVIVSMNGRKIPIYELEYNKIVYYPDIIEEDEMHKSLLGLTLKKLDLKNGKSFCIEYNFEKSYYFDLTVDNLIENSNDNANVYFKVLSGSGYGLIDDKDSFHLKALFNPPRRENYDSYYTKSEKEYLQKRFDVVEVNKWIDDYNKDRNDMFKPKQYIFNVSLEEFNKEIKRKILVNSDIMINDFCKRVIVSMNGDLSHGFGIKIGKEYLEEDYNEVELFYLNLKEKQRLKIIYDWGDSWCFNLTLSKIIDGDNEKDFEVLSGSGYGIIDDCGGTYGLYEIFNGESDYLEKRDINDFDLEKCNKEVEKV